MWGWLLDAAGSLVFLAILLVTDDIYLATGVGVAVGLAGFAWTWFRHRRIGGLQLASIGILVVMGGSTILLHDPRFVIAKPSILQAGFGVLMLRRGWMRRFLPPAAAEAPSGLIIGLGYAYAATMFTLAVANVVVGALGSQKQWALFSALVPWSVMGILGLISWRLIHRAVVVARRNRTLEA